MCPLSSLLFGYGGETEVEVVEYLGGGNLRIYLYTYINERVVDAEERGRGVSSPDS